MHLVLRHDPVVAAPKAWPETELFSLIHRPNCVPANFVALSVFAESLSETSSERLASGGRSKSTWPYCRNEAQPRDLLSSNPTEGGLRPMPLFLIVTTEPSSTQSGFGANRAILETI